MSKKHKNKGKKGGPRRSKNNGKFDLMGILSDKDVLIGGAAGLVGAAAVQALGGKFIKNPLILSAVGAIVPAVAVGYITKNRTSTIAAAGSGAAVGFGASVVSKISEMTAPKAAAPATVTQVKGLIGENIFEQTEGAIPMEGEDGFYYPQTQGFEDEQVEGGAEDDEDLVSGPLDEIA